MSEGWRRLDPRMLLVHPVTEGGRLAIPFIGVVVLGTGRLEWWHLLAVGIPVALGVWRYLTTQWRVTDEHLELRQGLIGRQVTRARLDKVRTVNLQSGVVHRLLRLSKVAIGTGTDEQLELNALRTDQARGLREELLHRRTPEGEQNSSLTASEGGQKSSLSAPEDAEMLAFQPGWLVYAPFTGTGLAIAGAAVAAVSGPFSDHADWVLDRARGEFEGLPVAALVSGFVLLVCVGLVVLSVVGYALTNWGFRFTRDRAGRSWHVGRGLLSTTEQSIDVDRVRGLTLNRGPALRMVGGATLTGLVTGVKEDAKTSATLAPAAPYDVVRDLATRTTGDPDAVAGRLVDHGPLARRRQVFRAARGLGVLALGLSVLLLLAATDAPWWVAALPWLLLLLAWPFGRRRARSLGHLLTDRHLVVAPPNFGDYRTLLLRSGVISWRFDQSIFQRRSGLTTLVATSAAGSKAHEVIDLDEGVATRVAHDAVPGLVAQFLEER